MQSDKSGIILFFSIYIIVGIWLLIMGIKEFKKGRRKLKDCLCETDGVIVDIKEEKSTDIHRGSNGHVHNQTTTRYTPIIQFQTSYGDTITQQASYNDNGSTNKSKVVIGTKVNIKYNPKDTSEFIVNNKIYGNFKLFIILFLIFNAFGILGLYLAIFIL
jgi:hypothetical protein